MAYTCRPRTLDVIGKFTNNPEHRTTSKYNPGPGTYEAPNALPGDGKTFYAKFKSSQFAKINLSPRFTLTKDSPGPNSYDVRNNFSREGKYILSHHRGEGTRAFSQTARTGFTDVISKNSISKYIVYVRSRPRSIREADGVRSVRRYEILQDIVFGVRPKSQRDHRLMIDCDLINKPCMVMTFPLSSQMARSCTPPWCASPTSHQRSRCCQT